MRIPPVAGAQHAEGVDPRVGADLDSAGAVEPRGGVDSYIRADRGKAERCDSRVVEESGVVHALTAARLSVMRPVSSAISASVAFP